MTPLISPPARGYADWQRIENWDSGLLVNLALANVQPTFQTAILDVSRYGYIAGGVLPVNGPILMRLIWYPDAQGSINIGQRFIVLSPSITNGAMLRLPNLGPYVQIIWTQIGNAGQEVTAQLFATNRVHPLELIPQQPVIVTQQAVAIGAGASVDVFPGDYCAGPCQVDLAVTQQPNVLQVAYLDNTGTWQVFASYNGTTTNDVVRTIITPAGAWKMTVISQAGAAGLYWLRVTPSPTGSS